MGSDNPPNNNINNYNNNNNIQIQKNYSNNQNINNDLHQKLRNDLQKESANLQPIRRHSNIRNMNNFQTNSSSKNVNPLLNNSIGGFPNNNNKQSNELNEMSKNKKLSQQYCANFKKNYMTNSRNSFLNHLADSLNHGTEIPIEEIEKFKEEYLPKYFLDWRNIEDPKTGIKYWKNFGKIYPDKTNKINMEKLNSNKIGASEVFHLKRGWF